MEIAQMDCQEIGEVVRLEQSCFSQPWSEGVFQAELQNGSALFLTARENGQLMGYVGAHIVLDEGYIANIAVDARYRRRGVAGALLLTLFKEAQSRELRFLTLEVRESNAPAIAFYEKMGFELVGKRKNFYEHPREDALLMTRRF